MEKTIALLKKEVGKKEYQDLKQRYLDLFHKIVRNASNKVKHEELENEREEVLQQIRTLISKNMKNVLEVFIEEFEQVDKSADAFIKFSEELVLDPQSQVSRSVLEEEFISAMIDAKVDRFFPNFGDVFKFTKGIYDSDEATAAVNESKKFGRKLIEEVDSVTSKEVLEEWKIPLDIIKESVTE
jgi:hypothetical protein